MFLLIYVTVNIKTVTSCIFCGRLAAQDFVMKCTEARAVWWPEVWKFIRVCYITALSDWRQRMMHRMSELTEVAEKITTSRIYQK